MPALRNKKFDRQYGAYLCGESMDSISRRLGISRAGTGRAFKRRGFKKRISKEGEGDNILAQSVQAQVDTLERKVASSKEDLEFLCEAKDLLDEYGYDFDKMEEINMGERAVFFNTENRRFSFPDHRD